MLEKTAFKMHKILKTAYSANTMGSTQVVEKFLSVLNWGHYGWRSWVFRTLVTQTKLEKVQKTTINQWRTTLELLAV